jgi:endonuclease/exonuclease/phosphatase (EEP) superfamily protein YafD
MFRREAICVIAATWMLFILAWLLPGSLQAQSTPAVIWTWCMMLVRGLSYQIGLFLLLIALIALLARQWPMALCCMPLILLVVVWPHFRPAQAPIVGTVSGQPLRVLSVNLLMVNDQTGPMFNSIRQANADVILLQEYTPQWHDALNSGLEDMYPHRFWVKQSDSFGSAIYSRFPWVDKPQTSLPFGDWGVPELYASVQVGQQIVDLYNIHLLPPRNLAYTREHLDQAANLGQYLASRSGRTIIVGGDFNFTGQMIQSDLIYKAGLVDAYEQARSGRGASWPVNSIFRFAPGIQLDHLYFSKGIRCRHIRYGEANGSDHYSVLADLVLETAPPPPHKSPISRNLAP